MEVKPRFIPKVVTEDIVISGMSGRYPESNSTDEFAENLYNNVDMITDDSRRWPSGLYGMDQRMGKLKDIEKFDGNFFGIINQVGDRCDPHLRLLLETTYEAIVDAGINPQTLRGSDTGVYIGYSTFGMPEGMPEEVQPDSQRNMMDTLLWVQGQAKCLYSNRISYLFDFKGPSIIIDTACSSSLVAFNTAMNDLRLGKCQQAIIGGTNVNLQPYTNHIFQVTRLNSCDGIPKVWDQNADGFVRGETVSCFLLQRRSEAKRVYATVLNSGVNIDGNKRAGMFFPSSESQEKLMIQVYKEANVDPRDVNYFEAHATGTKVGDPQEAKAIYNAYCFLPDRKGTLPIGLLKSNIGHAEGASGVSSVTKVLLAYENECIPANLHLNQIKSTIADMCPPLFPITKNFKYTPGIAGVNNFGVGGVNANVLLEPNYKTSCVDCLKIADTIPRIVNICSRTEEGMKSMISFIEKNPQKISRDFLALLADTMKTRFSLHSSGFPYRGSILIKQTIGQNNEIQYEYKNQFSKVMIRNQRPVWFVFPGLGGQWVGMAKALMPIKIFADKIEECHQILKEFGVDLKYMLLSDDKTSMSSMTNKFCATTALEIGMFDVMQTLGITPDGIIGHSFGEIAAAYADGCLTTREALFITYIRGFVTENDKKIPKGLMAVVGMSWTEVKKLCPPGVDVVCNNAKDSVVVSGIYSETKQLIENLKKRGVFVRELESHGIPYHSQYLMTSAQTMIDEIKKFVPNPKLRSKKWISTSIIESDTKEELKYASAEYFVNNLINPVYFYNKLPQLPEDAIVLEIGPHALFSKLVTQTLESSSYLSFIKKDSNDTNLEMFFTGIAKLYELGLNADIEKLYPKVEWPVSRGTQSISSLMRWDHSDDYYVRKYPDHHFKASASDMNEWITLSQSFKCYLPDHCIDGNVLFPATGYLMLAWRHLAASKGRLWNQIPVIFEDIQFRRAVFLSDTETSKLKVRYFETTGEFVILENNNISCLGRIRTPDEDSLCVQHLIEEQKEIPTESEITIDRNDIYKDLRIMGYDYGPMFRGLKNIATNDFQTMRGRVEWTGNWVTFMDSLLQTMAVSMPFRKMMVPVMIKSLKCDPKILFESVANNKITEEAKERIEEEFFDGVEQGKAASDESSVLDSNDSRQLLEEFVEKKFHIYQSILPFHVDMNSRMIVAPGVEIEDLMALPISRKSNIQDLKLESYQFTLNEDMEAIGETQKKSLSEYLKVCSNVSTKIQTALAINSNTVTNNVILDDLDHKYLNDIKEDQILLKVFDKCLKIMNESKDENENLDKKLANNRVTAFVSEIKENPEFDLSKDVINQVSRNEYLIRSLLDIVSENNVPKKEINVLEINLTNGLMANEVDNHLASAAIYPIDVNYTISVKSINGLPQDINKSFNLNEWDHKKTDFPSDIQPKDLIVVRDCHELWTVNLENHIQEIYDCLIDKGFLVSVFRTKLSEAEMSLISMNGKNKISDEYLQKRINDFLSSAKSVGFSLISSKFDSIGSMALLFRKVFSRPDPPEKDNIIEVNSKSDNWFESLKAKIIQNKESESGQQNIWLIGKDSQINGIVGLINCLRLEPGGEAIKCIFDCDGLIQKDIDFKRMPFSDILKNDLAVNVLKNGKLGTFRHLTLPHDYDKTESNEYFLNVGHNRDLSSLQWFDSKNIVPNNTLYDISNNRINQIRCQIYSSGINFRDVMFATGRIASGPQLLFTDCLIGFEFAGRRTDSRERICGFDMSRCFATSVDVNERLITKIPENWSMDDSVTILATYSTVWYGLLERAQLKKNESILIHSGAGGVGQAAIVVCQYYNCDIFVTVGTQEKKKFLMTEYNIPENRIFSSRDIQFKYKIKALTKGKGVNLVLNSLTGDKLEASYECVADCGRFVEIGKYDLQMNKQLGMFSFLRDISFIGVSVDRKLYFENGFTEKFFDWMHQNSDNGMIKPITRTVFKSEDAEKAFRYMTTGKHIGKIIIQMRDEESDKTVDVLKPAITLKTTTKTYFSPNKVYIITGGLGGFGLELVHWMLFLGARKFVLTSRYGAKSNYQKYVLSRISSMASNFKMYETEVVVSTHNSNTFEGADGLIQEANKLGTIGGVFHLALVLNDCLLENQTIDKFNETIESKTKIFENLDKLSRDLNLNLDYFVVFSSVSCGKGNGGQSNYGFANSVCERICESRRKDGLHGLAIQWGPIGDVGVLSETDVVSSLAGVVKQRINSCLDIFDKLLQTRESIVSCVVRAKRVTQSGSREARIVAQIWQALGIDPKTTPEHLTLGEIGMESMFAIELQSGLERDYDIKLTLNDIKNITIKNMKEFESGKVEVFRHYVKEIRIAREKLSKIKFIIPDDSFSRLNNVSNGKPVYFLPPLEGIFASLEGLAEKINRPVIGLNWTKDMENFNSVKDISRYYTNLLKKLEPKGNYDIVGHFYGALIAMKMLKKAPIGRAVIIDSLSGTQMTDEMLTDEYQLELIVKFISKDLPQVVKEKLLRDMKMSGDVDTKLNKLSSEIKEFVGKSLVSKHLDDILRNSFKRAKLFTSYRLNLKKKFKQMAFSAGKKYLQISGKLLIIKPFASIADQNNETEISDRIKDSYFLPEKGLEGKLNFQTVNENPDDLVFDKIAENINQYFDK